MVPPHYPDADTPHRDDLLHAGVRVLERGAMGLGSGRLEIMDDAAPRHLQAVSFAQAFEVGVIAAVLRLAPRSFLHL
jgi:hypothetical protein